MTNAQEGTQQQNSSNSSSTQARAVKPNYVLVKTVPGHAKAIAGIKFSPDGSLLASVGADRKLKLWSTQDGKFEKSFEGHLRGVNDLCWSGSNVLAEDGKGEGSNVIATVSDDNTCRVWDIAAGKCVRTLKGHDDIAFCVAMNPSGNLVSTGSFDRYLRCWDLRTSKAPVVVLAHSDPISSVDFHRDGSLIITSSFEGLVRIWDSANTQCLKSLGEDEPPISYAKFSPNGKYILTANFNSEIKLWDYCRVKTLKVYRGHRNEKVCLSCGFSVTGGKWIVSGSEDNKAVLWDLQSRELVQTLDAHNDAVISVAMHPKSNIIATATLEKDKTIRLWKSEF